MWRKIVAGLALFAALTNAADAGSGRVRAPQKLLLLGNAPGSAGGPTIRQIMTRSILSNTADSTNKQLMSRRWHFVRDNKPPQIVIANWFVQIGTAGAEVGSGGTQTVTASMEYPAGTCTPYTFGGASSIVVPDGVTSVPADPPAVTPPVGSVVWERIFINASAATVYVSNNATLAIDATRGDALHLAASGLADQTVSCDAVTTTDATRTYGAAAIVGNSSAPAMWFAGDSRGFGQGEDPRAFSSGDAGELARSFGSYVAYINAGVDGDQAQWMAANYTKRRALMAYTPTAAIWQPGVNDLNNSRTSTQVLGNLATLYGFHTNSYGATVAPVSTSTDSFVTVANQTTAASNTQRVALNTSLRGSTNGAKAIFDVAAAVESSLNSGKWNIPSPANVSFPSLTGDGLHEDTYANDLIRSTNNVDPNTIIPGTRPTGLNVERVANTNFPRDYSNWNPFNIQGSFQSDTSTATWSAGGVTLTVLTGKTFPGLMTPLYGTVVGQTYTVSVGLTGSTAPMNIRVAVDPQCNGTNAVLDSGGISGSTIYGATFVATSKTHYFCLQALTGTVGQSSIVQNASVKGPT